MIKLIGQLTIKLSWIIIDKSDIPLKRKSFMKSTFQRVMTNALCLMLCLSALPLSAAAEGDVEINEANFPDEVFRLYVKMFDNDGDGYLSEEERGWYCYPGEGGTYVGAYEIALNSANLISLKGIEFFPELLYLDCLGSELSSLDLSQNTLLKELSCGRNQLTSLNVSNSTELKRIGCSYNKLTALDVSKNTELLELSCYNNQLSTINISNNEKLKELDCCFNKLTALDITNNSELEYLLCYGNSIVKLDISNNPQLIQAVKSGIKEYENEYDFNDTLVDTVRYSIITLEGCSYFIEIPRTTRLQTGSLEPPAVTTQPKNVSAVVGNKVTLSVTAIGSGLKYQWYKNCEPGGTKNCEPISGATSNTLTIIVKEDMYESVYFCEVSNGGGVVCSNPAKITELKKPKITTQPKSAKVKVGKKVTFKVKATGENLKYQWYRLKPGTKKWVKISKATKASYSFKATKKWNGYKYRCFVKNEAGKVYSKAVKLTVKK